MSDYCPEPEAAWNDAHGFSRRYSLAASVRQADGEYAVVLDDIRAACEQEARLELITRCLRAGYRVLRIEQQTEEEAK